MSASVVPAVGDRVIIDAVLLGEEYAIEVVVIRVDVHPVTREPRIIARPYGSQLLTFARTSWRALPERIPA